MSVSETQPLSIEPDLSTDGNPLFGIESHGFDPIPESERTMRLKDLSRFWVGTNLYLFNFVIGGLVFTLGLTLWQSLICVLVGNLLYAMVALGSIPGMRSGVPTLTITRGAFGINGNRVNGVLAWGESIMFEVVNVVFGVFAVLALFDQLGWSNSGTTGKVVALSIVYSISATVSIMGHATVIWLQRVVAVLRIVIPVVFIYTFGDLNLGAAAAKAAGTWDTVALMITGAGIIAAGALAYMIIPSDYPRYLPSTSSSPKLFWTVLASAGGTALFMGCLGAIIASQADLSDPVSGVEPLIPSWLYVIFVLSVIAAALGNNVITLYSAGLIVQSAGVPLKRWQASILDAVVAIVVVCYVLFVNKDFNTTLNDAIIVLVLWVGPWSAVWLVDAALRRFRYTAADLHRHGGGRYWATGGVHQSAVVALLAGALAGYLVMNAPFLKGPLSDPILNGADGSWLAGPLVAAVVYYALAARRIRAAEVAVANAELA